MDDADGRVGENTKSVLSPSLGLLMLLSCSFTHSRIIAHACTGDFYKEQHLRSPHKAKHVEVRQTPALTRTFRVFMWNPLKVVPAVFLPSIYVPRQSCIDLKRTNMSDASVCYKTCCPLGLLTIFLHKFGSVF